MRFLPKEQARLAVNGERTIPLELAHPDGEGFKPYRGVKCRASVRLPLALQLATKQCFDGLRGAPTQGESGQLAIVAQNDGLFDALPQNLAILRCLPLGRHQFRASRESCGESERLLMKDELRVDIGRGFPQQRSELPDELQRAGPVASVERLEAVHDDSPEVAGATAHIGADSFQVQIDAHALEWKLIGSASCLALRCVQSAATGPYATS